MADLDARLAGAVTLQQIDLIRHALGLTREGVTEPWRNYFTAHEDAEDVPAWRDLVQKGFATEKPFSHAQRSLLFKVTDAGKALAARRAGRE